MDEQDALLPEATNSSEQNNFTSQRETLNNRMEGYNFSDFSEVETSDTERLLQLEDNVNPTPTVLRRRIGLLHAVALIVGQIIGSGIFISPSIVLKNSGSIGLTLVIWTFGGFLSMLGALCYCELGSMIEKSGGDYVYLKITYGKLASFLYSWLNVWLVEPSSYAIKSLTFSLYLTAVFGSSCNTLVLKFIAAVAIVVLSAINCASVSLSAKTQVFFTGAKLIGILLTIGVGLIALIGGKTHNFHNSFANTITSPGIIGHAMYAVMWSYDGWPNLNIIAEELKNPDKNFIRCMCISIPLITVCYVAINIAYFSVLSPTEMLASNAVAFTFAHKLSPVFGTIMPIIVATSCIGSINSSIFSSARGMFSMSRENQMPKVFSFVNRKTQTPIPAILFRSTLGLLMLVPASIEPLMNCLLFVEWIIFGLIFSAVLLLRWKKPNLPRPYKVPLPIPIFLLPVSFYFIVIPFISNPMESVMGLGLVAAGIPVYYLFLVKQWTPRSVSRVFKRLGYGSQLLCNVIEPAIPKAFDSY